jgi:hypothetical protein
MNSTTLKFTMLSAAAKITVNDSAIGPVSVTLLNFVANYVIKHQVIPELNKAGSRGIPLPALDHIQLVNTDLLLQQNALCVSTDLRYIGDDFGNNRQTVDRHQESPMYFEVASELDENITGDLR